MQWGVELSLMHLSFLITLCLGRPSHVSTESFVPFSENGVHECMFFGPITVRPLSFLPQFVWGCRFSGDGKYGGRTLRQSSRCYPRLGKNTNSDGGTREKVQSADRLHFGHCSVRHILSVSTEPAITQHRRGRAHGICAVEFIERRRRRAARPFRE
jgi:hypothetical protein